MRKFERADYRLRKVSETKRDEAGRRPERFICNCRHTCRGKRINMTTSTHPSEGRDAAQGCVHSARALAGLQVAAAVVQVL